MVEILIIRNKITEKHKNLTLEEIIDRLKLDNLDIYTNILGLNYKYKNKNNKEKREKYYNIWTKRKNKIF